jgi:hypothetical protein
VFSIGSGLAEENLIRKVSDFDCTVDSNKARMERPSTAERTPEAAHS